MKKVLHLLNTSSFSGAENVAITIISNMNNNFSSAYVSYDGAIRDVLINEGIEFLPIKSMSVRELSRVINQYNPDIIHAHDYTTSIVAAFSTFKIPIVSHLHNNTPWIKKINLRSLTYLISTLRYTKVLGVSDSIFSEYVFGNVIKNKQIIISNPIDLQMISKKSNELLEDKSKVYDIIFLGRLEEQKDPVRFVEIIKKVTETLPKIRIAIVGDGVLKMNLKQTIENYGISDNIKMLGFLKNPYVVLAKSKILCMTSKWEGFGLVAVEALIFGLPVISTKVGGVPTIINNTCGYLTDNDDDYHDEIVKLLTSNAYYKKKSIEAEKRSADFDKLDEYMKKIQDIYNNSID